jgi:hypothetical protein
METIPSHSCAQIECGYVGIRHSEKNRNSRSTNMGWPIFLSRQERFELFGGDAAEDHLFGLMWACEPPDVSAYAQTFIDYADN